jgi:N-dimethylarginine dimethylaminohydrolase
VPIPPLRRLERPVRLREPKHLQQRISAITLKIVTITYTDDQIPEGTQGLSKRHTVVIALTIAINTEAMAEMIALMPLPIAEKIEP